MNGRWIYLAVGAAGACTAALHGAGWLGVVGMLCYVIWLRYVFRPSWLKPVFLTAAVAVIYMWVLVFDAANQADELPEEGSAYAVISETPQVDGDRLRMPVEIAAEGIQVQAFAFLQNEAEKQKSEALKQGMECYMTGEFERPSTATNFHAFDYKEYLYTEQIHWQWFLEAIPVDCQPAYTWLDYLEHYRQAGVSQVASLLEDPFAGVAAALLFGERKLLDPEVETMYQRLGLIHVLAVSGLHVGIVSFVVYRVFIRFALTKVQALTSLVWLLPLYALLTGAAPSVVRAALIGMLVALALRFHWKLSPLDGLGFAALLMLWADPYYIQHIGFQLSFLITAAIILSRGWLFEKKRNYLSQLFFVSLISQIAAVPVLLYHFHEFSWISPLLNLWFVPFMTLFIMPAAALSFFIVFIHPSLLVIFSPVNSILSFIHDALITVESWRFGFIVFGQPSLGDVFVLSLATAGLLLSFECHRRVMFIAWSGWVLLLGWPAITASIDQTGKVTMLDVGQGDSIVIQWPQREAVDVIDAGGIVSFINEDESWREQSEPFEPGRDVVGPYLKSQGITKIDRLIITHGHWDHYGGAFHLLEAFDVRKVVYGAVAVDEPGEQRFLHAVAEAGSEFIQVRAGDSWMRSDAPVQVLAPIGHETDLNDRSIVLQKTIGQMEWLFMGDLETEGERRLVQQERALEEVDVLKAGHHGSRTSTTPDFLEAVSPEAVLISAGRNNLYGHPHEEVIERLEMNEVPALRTDQLGAVRYTFQEGVPGKFEAARRQKEVTN
ncbi:DNA internalization-related competence protein ComEC/Rec2 [Salsuginibacillus halophilus]|uniref:DNA internalization-related competence protein ComEC/Rec2 n=1 Tax=Salsuginibacillus halophilus TaxID=517424 RepID=UPI0015E78E58|nr:DNA internalization-related competence protein ComEC/Rec2 [Salsuginibacillus halophilus]